MAARKTLIKRLLEERKTNLGIGQIQDDTQTPKRLSSACRDEGDVSVFVSRLIWTREGCEVAASAHARALHGAMKIS